MGVDTVPAPKASSFAEAASCAKAACCAKASSFAERTACAKAAQIRLVRAIARHAPNDRFRSAHHPT
jgi:hypothetical protein